MDRGKRRRRSYAKAFKRRVVAETLDTGASVAEVARRHGLNANMVFLWRGDPRFGPGRDAAAFLPVEVGAVEISSISVRQVPLIEDSPGELDRYLGNLIGPGPAAAGRRTTSFPIAA